MSELRSVVDVLRAEILSDLPDARLEDDFAELHRTVELLEAERLRRLAEIERRGLFQRDGHLSAASWLAERFKVAWGAAKENVRVARALDEMPVARRALDDGELSMSAARVLVSARHADPAAFERSEATLVEAARIHSMHDLKRVAGFWREEVEREQALGGEEKLRARRRLQIAATFLGMVRVDGDLDPETGETLMTALSAVLDAESRSRAEADERTPDQRRADALGEICRQWLDLADRPKVAGERPHVTVTLDAAALGGGEGGAELDHSGAVAVEAARRLACDASLLRRRDGRAFGTARRRQTYAGRSSVDASRGDRAGPPLSVPRLRPAAHVVRRAPCGPLGRRRTHRASEPPASVSTSPPAHP